MELFIPGHGNMTSQQFLIVSALKDYDEKLMFARNEETGDWCVYSRMPHPEPPFPVFGFGPELPDKQIVLDRVKSGDLRRNSDRIYNEIVKSQEKYRADLAYKGDQASGESAEVVEKFMRIHGKSPVIKSLPKNYESKVSGGDK
jgi:hypothetical protein